MPRYWLFSRQMITGVPCTIAVAISWIFIWKPPSPVTQTTSLSRFPIFAPIAAGKPNPIVPSPPEVIIWRFSSMSKYCVAHIWFCPTSVTKIASSNVLLMRSMIICGVMPRSLRISSGFFSFHALIFSCHAVVSFGSAHSNNFSKASFASETIGTSTTTFLEIDAVSTSMCTIFALGANSFRSPVILSLNLVPMENNTSHSLTALLHAYFPCIPVFPI